MGIQKWAMGAISALALASASHAAGFINGGLMSRSESLAGATVVVVDVDDIEAALAKIESLGGSTVQAKLPVGDMGFSAYAKDSEGNVIGLWQTAAAG